MDFDIPHIKLLSGSHSGTGRTGTGCFMNVIAYLNGEQKITDRSECVCYVMRPMVIWANDWMNDEERPALLPFILRAMGSRTDDREEISRRLALVVAFAFKQAQYAAQSVAQDDVQSAAKSAAKYAAKSVQFAAEDAARAAERYAARSAQYVQYAAKYAQNAAQFAAEDAARSAESYAARSATKSAARYAQDRKENCATIIELFDAAFPPLTGANAITMQRIRKLESIAA